MALNAGFAIVQGFANGPQNDYAAALVQSPAPASVPGVFHEARSGRFPVMARASNGTSNGPEVSLFMDSDDPDYRYAGSIVEACVSTTVYALQCTSYAGRGTVDFCGRNGPSVTLTEGPGTYHVTTALSVTTMGVRVDGELMEDCSLDGTTKAVCTATVKASASKKTTSSVTSSTATGSNVYWFNVPITAGAEKTASPSQCAKSAASGLNMKSATALALLGAMGVTALLGF
jgi:hypothetical protein